MKTHLLTLCIILGAFFSISLIHAKEDLPTHGEWGDERYRTIVPAPPTLSIEGNVLSIHFVDALDGVIIQITNKQGVVRQEVISGESGECISIVLDQEGTGNFQVMLEHRLGWLLSEFII